MQLNQQRINQLEREWQTTTHPEEKRAIVNLAAQHCQDCGQRLKVSEGRFQISDAPRIR